MNERNLAMENMELSVALGEEREEILRLQRRIDEQKALIRTIVTVLDLMMDLIKNATESEQ